LRVFSIARKELASYFNSPIGYVVSVAFLVFTSSWFFYFERFFVRNVASLRQYFGVIPAVFLFLIPALTMRSWAEERKSGTLEVLLTLPLRELEVVGGKFLAAAALLVFMMALTVPLPLSLAPLGSFDAGQIFCQYAGAVLMGCAGISVGLLVSAFSRHQIGAYMASCFILLCFTMADQAASIANLPPRLMEGINSLCFRVHFESFAKGVLDSRDIAYFALLSAFFLFLNSRVLEWGKGR
jgi:ABC-2 type transport system permease protein